MKISNQHKENIMKTLLTTLCLSILTIAAVAAPTEQEALKDWNDLDKANETLEQKISKIVPSYVPNIIGTDDEKILTTLNDFENNDLPGMIKLLEQCQKKYGDTPEQINKTVLSIVQIDNKSGKHPTTQIDSIFKKVKKWIDNIAQAKKNKAEILVNEANSIQNKMNSFASHQTQKNQDELKKKLETALKYDPDNKKAKETLKNAGAAFKKARAALDNQIDNAKWPGNYKNFAGPGNPDKLAAAALEYFKNDEGWGSRKKNPEHCIAVAIRGNWGSSKKNILGQTIQWYLPVYLAIYRDKDEDKSIAHVFELSLLTKEEANVEKAPPFTGVTVGNIWKIRRNNIKGGAGCGFFGSIFWLGLAFGNIIAGLLAAAPLLKTKVPQLKTVYEKITPFANIIGVIILAIGVLSLLGAFLQLFILRFVILSNIIPQLSAIAVGLFLGKEILMRKPKLENISKISDSDAAKKAEEAAENATAKTQELLRKYEDKIDLLEKYQEKIGIACIVIGILHLFLGCWPLI